MEIVWAPKQDTCKHKNPWKGNRAVVDTISKSQESVIDTQ
jgi:hypothetical protein